MTTDLHAARARIAELEGEVERLQAERREMKIEHIVSVARAEEREHAARIAETWRDEGCSSGCPGCEYYTRRIAAAIRAERGGKDNG